MVSDKFFILKPIQQAEQLIYKTTTEEQHTHAKGNKCVCYKTGFMQKVGHSQSIINDITARVKRGDGYRSHVRVI